MSKDTTIIARVGTTKREKNSVYGNPAYTVALVTESGDISIHRTMSNAGISYAINNPEYRDDLHEWHLTPAGRIKFARKLAD